MMMKRVKRLKTLVFNSLVTGSFPLLGACGAPEVANAGERRAEYWVDVQHVSVLDVSRGAILASANSIARGRDGRLYIGDGSDRAIKVFGAGGAQERPIGVPGPGPGEFATLLSAGLLGDSIFGWDGTSNRLTVFNPEGEDIRAVMLRQPGSPVWSRIRAMDDSLLVASGWVQGSHDQPLVEVYDRRGHVVGKMMDLSRLLSPPDPEFLQHTSVFADGSGGVVYSTIHGVDTLFAHTQNGDLLGTGRLGLTGHQPVLDLRRLLARNGGRLRQADGNWAQDGHFAVLKLVALTGNLVAVQFARLDLSGGGTDLLSEGGPIVVLRLTSGGQFHVVGQVEAPGALLGRSGPGEAYILQWSGSDLTELHLFRLSVTSTTTA